MKLRSVVSSGGSISHGSDRRRHRRESESKSIFHLGTGFVARHVSVPLMKQGWKVSGTCTSSPNLEQLRSLGIDAHLFDASSLKKNIEPSGIESIRPATHLLVSVPPIADPLLRLHGKKLLHPLLDSGNLRWLCYLSSTGVYGDCGGAWVDEDYPVNPTTDSAKLRLRAEKEWTDFGLNLGLSTFVFRLGGIYGPGRSALDTLMKRKDLSENQKRRVSKDFYYTARIHVADICQAIISSIANPSLGNIYNLVDDDPAPRAEVFAFARDLISQKYPDMASEFKHVSLVNEQKIIGEKRVSNARMKEKLGVQLLYPSYKSGLQSIFDSWLSAG